ncbi:helix-turn-helix transcriptional regulator [Arthrobacter rhombi]|uniref:helix-turn-helix transcriptional regulator n=1 Tax=Arthrobacter rhombi TaxID=71253 RepID=UPI003F91BCB9
MEAHELQELMWLRRARDLMDRDFADSLDVPTMAGTALMSPAHFSRRFKAAYGESPYAYLMTRRIERAMTLLRGGVGVTDACLAVGCTSLGSFSSSFTRIAGVSPTQYRALDHAALQAMPGCLARLTSRPTSLKPSRIREAPPVIQD